MLELSRWDICKVEESKYQLVEDMIQKVMKTVILSDQRRTIGRISTSNTFGKIRTDNYRRLVQTKKW